MSDTSWDLYLYTMISKGDIYGQELHYLDFYNITILQF